MGWTDGGVTYSYNDVEDDEAIMALATIPSGLDEYCEISTTE